MAVFSTNLVIYKYTDFEQTFVLEDSQTNSLKDLTGFTVAFTNRLNGKVRISLSNTQTGEIEEGKYFYELVLTDPNDITERVIEGTVIVKHPVTWPSPPPLTPFDAQVP